MASDCHVAIFAIVKMSITCRYCGGLFASIGMGDDTDAEHDWIICSERIADEVKRLRSLLKIGIDIVAGNLSDSEGWIHEATKALKRENA